jgi:hypothetical protein
MEQILLPRRLTKMTMKLSPNSILLGISKLLGASYQYIVLESINEFLFLLDLDHVGWL